MRKLFHEKGIKTAALYDFFDGILTFAAPFEEEVTAKANGSGAQVTGGADTVSLKTGTNTHYIKVKATSGLSRTYTLTIIRK